MSTLISGFEYDIFISYRHNDNRSGWVTEFVNAANPTLIEYYKTFGFNIIENYTTPDSVELPVHNRNLALTLLEYQLTDNDQVTKVAEE